MSTTITATEARRRWADVFSQAVEARWPVPIERGGDERGLLIGFEEVKLLLDPYAFSTEVFFESDAVSIWLPELHLDGRGATFEDAQADLVEEVNAYVEEFLSDARLYLRSPNRAAHFPWVLRAYVASASGELTAALFAPPDDGPVPVATA
jgi:Antitoxin of toxin-antitoxin, RelE / RelB, TA system